MKIIVVGDFDEARRAVKEGWKWKQVFLADNPIPLEGRRFDYCRITWFGLDRMSAGTLEALHHNTVKARAKVEVGGTTLSA